MSDEFKKVEAEMEAARDQIAAAHKRANVEWETFNEVQRALPPSSRLTYEAWFAQTWGQRISVLENHYSIVTTRWAAAAQKASKA